MLIKPLPGLLLYFQTGRAIVLALKVLEGLLRLSGPPPPPPGPCEELFIAGTHLAANPGGG